MDKTLDRTLEDNPLRAGLRFERTPAPCIVVIFGASGDLAKRKIMPALYHLAREGLLPPNFSVVGFARTDMDDNQFREMMRESVSKFSRTGKVEPAVWDSFAQGMYYCDIEQYDDPNNYPELKELLKRVDAERGTDGNRLFYLATPPTVFEDIIRRLERHNMDEPDREGAWRRIIVEKPFGTDKSSAWKLNHVLQSVFDEDEIFRIDHYLGKETVQNLLVFRFANTIFEPVWNRRYVDHVQITVAERVGVEGRGGYYEAAGALRDIIQNHGLQLLAVTAMEPPVAFEARSVRDEKVKVLRSVRPLEPVEAAKRTVRGQYTAGVIGGEQVPGYREEPGVATDSTTETYVAMQVNIDNWRWAGVPFYLRTGKRLTKRETEIAIQFKLPPLLLFPGAATDGLRPNVLAINIQPDEGVSLTFEAKVPGQALQMRPVHMDFRYGAAFGEDQPDAYERLLLDAMLGDATLFTREDEVEAQWRITQPILDAWRDAAERPFDYSAGSWGPREADAFLEAEGRRWRRL